MASVSAHEDSTCVATPPASGANLSDDEMLLCWQPTSSFRCEWAGCGYRFPRRDFAEVSQKGLRPGDRGYFGVCKKCYEWEDSPESQESWPDAAAAISGNDGCSSEGRVCRDSHAAALAFRGEARRFEKKPAIMKKPVVKKKPVSSSAPTPKKPRSMKKLSSSSASHHKTPTCMKKPAASPAASGEAK